MTLHHSIGAGLFFALATLPNMAPAQVGVRTGVDEQLFIPTSSLELIVQPIKTVAESSDGSRTISIGSGFVIGRRYYTVNHNLTTPAEADARRTIYIDGVALTPSVVQAAHDIAVFELPDSLCREHCNGFAVNAHVTIRPGRQIVWLRKFADEVTLKHGTILNLALLGSSDDWSCNGNLIVEIDQPFIQGSSGGPVLDAETGSVVGIIQGTLIRNGVETGYFKPIDCVEPTV